MMPHFPFVSMGLSMTSDTMLLLLLATTLLRVPSSTLSPTHWMQSGTKFW